MSSRSLKRYCEAAMQAGAKHALVISPERVVTAPWVRWKCRYGCPGYGRSHCCPPETPDYRETRELLDSYQRAILTHLVMPHDEGRERREKMRRFTEELVRLEGEIFKDGFYKAFSLQAGPCLLCKDCEKMKGEVCKFGRQARPSLESCGIDVYQTAHNHGLPIVPLREKTETQNIYCLILID